MSTVIRYGILSGFLACFICTLMYVYNPSLFLDFGLIGCFVAAIVCMILAAKKILLEGSVSQSVPDSEDASDVFISFSEMLAVLFRVFLMNYVITFFFVYLLFNVYDTSLTELVKQQNIELMLANKDSSVTEALFQERLKEVKKIDFAPRLTDILSIQSLFRLVIGFVLSLILAFAFKRDKPTYLT